MDDFDPSVTISDSTMEAMRRLETEPPSSDQSQRELLKRIESIEERLKAMELLSHFH